MKTNHQRIDQLAEKLQKMSFSEFRPVKLLQAWKVRAQWENEQGPKHHEETDHDLNAEQELQRNEFIDL